MDFGGVTHLIHMRFACLIFFVFNFYLGFAQMSCPFRPYPELVECCSATDPSACLHEQIEEFNQQIEKHPDIQKIYFRKLNCQIQLLYLSKDTLRTLQLINEAQTTIDSALTIEGKYNDDFLNYAEQFRVSRMTFCFNLFYSDTSAFFRYRCDTLYSEINRTDTAAIHQILEKRRARLVSKVTQEDIDRLPPRQFIRIDSSTEIPRAYLYHLSSGRAQIRSNIHIDLGRFHRFRYYEKGKLRYKGRWRIEKPVLYLDFRQHRVDGKMKKSSNEYISSYTISSE